MDDVLAAEMAARASDKGITYVAFTATPKAKTLELFGRRPKPQEPAREPDNLPQPFHVYSMRQAIEEGFILDVLRNYTPYKLASLLAGMMKPCHGQRWHCESNQIATARFVSVQQAVRLLGVTTKRSD
jgi:hypothetical protein